MSSGFYEDLINEIEELIRKEQWQSARTKVDTELSMPYVPRDVLSKLKEFDLQLRQKAGEDRKGYGSVMSLEQIEEYLRGDREQQLLAVDAMNSLNLRSCMDVIDAYLGSDPDPLASALLIDSLIDQQISQEVTLDREGVQVTFIPRYQEAASESDGFLEAQKWLHEWLENEDPTLLKLCEQVLIREAYLALPLGFEQEEGLPLAAGCAKNVILSMQNETEWDRFMHKNRLENVKIFELKSQFV